MTNNEAIDGGVGRPINPALQLLILLVPVVLNGFFLVYALVGLILEGDSMQRWRDEALEVSLWVCAVILGYSLFQHLLMRARQLPANSLLNISAIGHAVLGIVLAALVVVLV